MNFDFSDAMRQASKLARAQKLMEATRLIQAALAGQPLPSEGADGSQPPTREQQTRFRRPLAEVVNTLRRAKEQLKTPSVKRNKTLIVPEGAQFLSGSYSCAAGRRDYRLYVPNQRQDATRALILMLHGCKQDPVDFALGTQMNAVAEEIGIFVLYPAQKSEANPMACWNWFNPKDQLRDLGEPAILAGMTREIVGQYNIDPRKVFVAGLSAGGAMTAVLAATYPDLYAGAGIHSGLPYRAANDVSSAFAAMRGEVVGNSPPVAPRVRTIVFHGDADPTVHLSNADRIIASQAGVGDTVTVEQATGSGYTRTIVSDPAGKPWCEHWVVHGGRHGWSGGSPDGSFTESRGPNASREMVRFFLTHAAEETARP